MTELLLWLPWLATAIFVILFLLNRAAMRSAVIKNSILGEFIAIAMIDPVVLENNRAVFLKWLSEEQLSDDPASLMKVIEATESIASSFVRKLGPIQGLRAFLNEQKLMH